jgi:hypothetical protein
MLVATATVTKPQAAPKTFGKSDDLEVFSPFVRCSEAWATLKRQRAYRGSGNVRFSELQQTQGIGPFLRLSKAIMENALLKNSVYFWSNLPDTPSIVNTARWIATPWRPFPFTFMAII